MRNVQKEDVVNVNFYVRTSEIRKLETKLNLPQLVLFTYILFPVESSNCILRPPRRPGQVINADPSSSMDLTSEALPIVIANLAHRAPAHHGIALQFSQCLVLQFRSHHGLSRWYICTGEATQTRGDRRGDLQNLSLSTSPCRPVSLSSSPVCFSVLRSPRPRLASPRPKAN